MRTAGQAPGMMRIMIVDDEPLARRGLEQLLSAHRDCRIVASCRNGRDMAHALPSAQPDLVLLDVQMPLHSGFDILELVGDRLTAQVVFVTAHDGYAVRAFEERAVDYLLKPVSQERFDRALERVRERLRAERLVRASDDRAIATEVQGADVATGVLSVPMESGEVVLTAQEIDWIEAVDYRAAVHAGGRRFLLRESLVSLERQLDPHAFVRVHRSAIVRRDRIRELRSMGRGRTMLILRDGTKLPVSRRRRARILALVRGG